MEIMSVKGSNFGIGSLVARGAGKDIPIEVVIGKAQIILIGFPAKTIRGHQEG